MAIREQARLTIKINNNNKIIKNISACLPFPEEISNAFKASLSFTVYHQTVFHSHPLKQQHLTLA
jgi:hypothetical protein